jgi:hypothetical protein
MSLSEKLKALGTLFTGHTPAGWERSLSTAEIRTWYEVDIPSTLNEAATVLEAAEAWYLAHTAENIASPTSQQAYDNAVADEHGRDAADAALLAALAAPGPSQEKERT